MECKFTVETEIVIDKSEEMIFSAVAMVPNTLDREQDWISSDELEKAAAGYLKDSRKFKLAHKSSLDGAVELMESFIAPEGFTLNGFRVPKGSWVIKAKVLMGDLWGLIKNGYRSLSVGGTTKARDGKGGRELYDATINEISICEQGMVPAARIVALKSESQEVQRLAAKIADDVIEKLLAFYAEKLVQLRDRIQKNDRARFTRYGRFDNSKYAATVRQTLGVDPHAGQAASDEHNRRWAQRFGKFLG